MLYLNRQVTAQHADEYSAKVEAMMANSPLQKMPMPGGIAHASIISGRLNPSGKLSITFPLTTGPIPTYYNMRQSSRLKQGGCQGIANIGLALG